MKKQTFIPALCASTVALASVLPAHSALPDGAADEIVVTGTRTPVSVTDSLSSVTVISRDQLDALQPLDLVDVFRQVPGIDISRSGGPGSSVSLFVRGAGSDQTLILVDGQRISSATLGDTSFQFLDPSQIERIEVVRGADSSLYGSDAIGGVIQIFTKDGSGTANSYVSTAGGSNKLWQTSVGSNGKVGDFRYGLNASYLETDGFDNLVDDNGFNSDRDGYRNDSVSASVGYEFGSVADLSLRFLQSNSRNHHDSAFNPGEKPYVETWLQNIKADLSLSPSDFWLSRLSLGTATDDSDHYDDITNTRGSHFRTERDQALWQNDFSIGASQTFTLGYEYYQDQVTASDVFEDPNGTPVDSRTNQAAFVQYQAGFGPFSSVLGVRNDDNEEFGNHSTGNIALGYNLSAQHRVLLSWSEGFKAPTFNDLYWPASPWSAGNPDLLPETSENYELGFRGDYAAWYWSATYFQNDIDNLIDWAAGSDFVWRPRNVNKAEITGGEIMAGGTVGGFRVEGSVTYVDPIDAEQGTVLTNRAKQTGLLSIDRELNRWSLGLAFKAQSERYNGGDDSDTLAGYGTVGARVAYRHDDNLSARLKVNNLFDRDYQLNDGYNQEGINWQLSVSYSL